MELNLEDLLKEYKSIADQLEDEDIKLDKAIDLYEKSNEIYKELNKKIIDSKQRIIDIRESDV